ncbi:uncharacterized protein LOC125942934 [Dermacentor silvarum]|uniref:uncharacterized protein LOC125942934 n=1 Tax=Dermacentor silvarum TaxID=543639 RepID=UPI002101A0C1|nr:uncharacterized protein LOC125942934 [Dermacentor silvarum]
MSRSTKSRRTCCVVGCTNTPANTANAPEAVHFYRFPAWAHFGERRQTWIRLVRRQRIDGAGDWEPGAHARICSRHFVGNRKSDESSSPSYNPSIFPAVYKKRSLPADCLGRYNRLKKRRTNAPGPSSAPTPAAPTVGKPTDELLHNADNRGHAEGAWGFFEVNTREIGTMTITSSEESFADPHIFLSVTDGTTASAQISCRFFSEHTVQTNCNS